MYNFLDCLSLSTIFDDRMFLVVMITSDNVHRMICFDMARNFSILKQYGFYLFQANWMVVSRWRVPVYPAYMGTYDDVCQTVLRLYGAHERLINEIIKIPFQVLTRPFPVSS